MQKESQYLDRSLPVEDRVIDLLARMSTEEKIGQLIQVDARVDLKHNIIERYAGSMLHASPRQLMQAADYVSQTRLRIPLLIGDDLIHGYSFWPGATIFPTQLAMAASWDPELIERVARATAQEAAPTGVHWTFSPVLCIARDLRWGRVDETFGEDPYLIGELGSAMVRGYQGRGLGDHTALLATAKHFAGYSETQGGRDASEADISRRKLRSWFLPPFERVAREGCATFMLGYESIDGVPITVNRWLLNDVLRSEWGYRGMLVTDWDNVGRMIWEQKLQPDIAHAAAAAIRAGNDMIMTTPSFFEGALEALRKGMVGVDDIDAAVSRVLTLKFRLGLFENPRLPDVKSIAAAIGTKDHERLNLQVARRSIVLLRNTGVLPLDEERRVIGGDDDIERGHGHTSNDSPQDDGASRLRAMAVLGPLADDAQAQLGDWAGGSGQVPWLDGQPREMITTVVDGLREIAGDAWSIRVARGADILTTQEDPEGGVLPDGQPRPRIAVPAPVDASMLKRATELFDDSDIAVVVVGDHIELVGEGRSTATLELFGAQNALIDAVAQASQRNHKPFVIVMMASKPLVLPRSAQCASAILWAGNPGMQGGRAIAEIIFGRVEPSGRLPISFARHAGQLPVYYNQIRGQHGTRYADLTQAPAFAFGEGLSYTTVTYDRARLVSKDDGSAILHRNDSIKVRVTLTNSGDRPCLETVQLYIRDVVTSATWADKELKGFRKIMLPAGQTRSITLSVPVESCSIVNADGERVVEDGDFEALIGHSSKDEDLLAIPFTVV